MTATRHSSKPVVADGSALHYALLFADPRAQEIQIAILELASELSRAGRTPREPEVARSRVEWWNEELMRLAEGAPRHPLTLTLARLCDWYRSDFDLLEQMVKGAENEIGLGQIETDEELALHGFRSDGCAMALGIRKTLGARSTTDFERSGIWLGRGIRLTEIVRRFNLDLVAGRILIPESLFRESGASIPTRPSAPIDATLRPALLAVVDRSDQHLARARCGYIERPFRAMTPYWVAGCLYQSLNRKLRRRLETLPPEQVVLSQAGMLWRAWRCARGAGRLIETTDGALS